MPSLLNQDGSLQKYLVCSSLIKFIWEEENLFSSTNFFKDESIVTIASLWLIFLDNKNLGPVIGVKGIADKNLG